MVLTVVAEYVWLGGNSEFRSKSRTLYMNELTLENIPRWNYDGSSTGQAKGSDSEIILHPVSYYNDPFRKSRHRGRNILVMCTTYTPDDIPLSNNHRHWAEEVFSHNTNEEPWFGMEQEYFLINPETNMPIGFDKDVPQGQFYCSVGAVNTFGRIVADTHYHMCLEAGIKISGVNAEVAPGQWEFQVGPCGGLEMGDHLLMARYILERVAENYQLVVDYHPKPLSGDWNGSGCHTNYSTISTRSKNGLNVIYSYIELLRLHHEEHMEQYGADNHLRMTGKHETASYDTFTYGRANRGASVRIGNETVKNGYGYFEDRRPASNCDPYLVCGMMFNTTVNESVEPAV